MYRHVKTIEGYAAVKKTDYSVALSHENCDWLRPIASDDISNAVVLPTSDAVRAHFSGYPHMSLYKVRKIRIKVDVDD